MGQLELIVALLLATLTVFSTFAYVVIWIIRLEGKVNLLNGLAEERKTQHIALTVTIENLSRSVENNFQRVFDKLDNKADKER